MKKNEVREIREIKQRAQAGKRHEYLTRILELYTKVKKSYAENKLNHELLNYLPIATVACFEAFFKSVIKDLVDRGNPYLERAYKINTLKNNFKIDFEALSVIQKRTLTIGDLLSHFLSFSSVEQIDDYLSVILELKFMKEFEKFCNTSPFSFYTTRVHHDFSTLMKSVFETYRTRHILCHEFTPDNSEVDVHISRFEDCINFLALVDSYILAIVHANPYTTEKQIEDAAQKEFETLDLFLSNLIQTVLKCVQAYQHVDKKQFLEAMDIWRKFRTAKAQANTIPYNEEAARGASYLHELSYMTLQMIRDLQEEFENELRKRGFVFYDDL